MAGIMKATDLQMIAGYIDMMGLPMPLLFAWGSMLLEIIAGGALLLGYKTKYSAAALLIFTVLVTLIFHTDFSNEAQQPLFTKNLAIMGGLLYMLSFGSGAIALDRRRS